MIEHAPRAVWVNVTEGAQITGYSRKYLVHLTKRIWDKPENEREIRLLKRSSGYELWLPDLIAYIEEIGYGPRHKDKSE